MVPEDSRISKLLRRLCREDDSEKFLVLCKQLQVGRYVICELYFILSNLIMLDMLVEEQLTV